MVSFQDMLLHATGPSLMRFPLFGIVTSLVKTSLVALSQVSLLSNILEYGSSFIIIGMIVWLMSFSPTRGELCEHRDQVGMAHHCHVQCQ